MQWMNHEFLQHDDSGQLLPGWQNYIKQCTEFDQVIYIVDVIKAHSEIVLAFSNAHKAI
jgi:hypothetical protein